MLRKWLTVLIITVVSMTASAQIIHPPTEVDSAFASKYPGAKMIVWKVNNAGYEADFEMNKSVMRSAFSLKGEWQRTISSISFKELPVAIADSFKVTRYGKIPIKAVMKVEMKSNALMYTIITIKGVLNKTSLVFSEEGHLISIKNFL